MNLIILLLIILTFSCFTIQQKPYPDLHDLEFSFCWEAALFDIVWLMIVLPDFLQNCPWTWLLMVGCTMTRFSYSRRVRGRRNNLASWFTSLSMSLFSDDVIITYVRETLKGFQFHSWVPNRCRQIQDTWNSYEVRTAWCWYGGGKRKRKPVWARFHS